MAQDNSYFRKLRELLSLEYNCSPCDFGKKKNVLTVSKLREGRRVYSPEKYFFHMVTTGDNAVITAEECLHPFLREFMRERTGHWLFEIPNLLPLEKELNRFGYTLTQTYHMFLPGEKMVDTTERSAHAEKQNGMAGSSTQVNASAAVVYHDAPRNPGVDYTVRWFHDEEIHPFYGDERFPNAICPEYTSTRPDRIVVCACDGDEIIGMAGCSEDAPGWMQIGIDVMPEYRSKGVATYLVNLLKNKILERGEIPFYGTSVSNYHSWNVALNCGFRPAWVEIGAQKKAD